VTKTFDSTWAEQAVRQLTERGVQFSNGLSILELAAISASFATPVPAEFEQFLSVGVPVSPKWARWVEGPDAVAADAKDWLGQQFAFDIEHNQYWHALFGARPRSNRLAVDRALEFLSTVPPLIPVYSHRFLVTAPLVGPRAVLSVWQPIDSIFYGYDLADYFAREFGVERPPWAASEAPRVPVWEDLFDLFCLASQA